MKQLHGALIATRVFFFIAGFGYASWAPLVPILKLRLAIGEDTLGLLLLCIGLGSLCTMPIAGTLARRFGCRRVMQLDGAAFAFILLALYAIPDVSWAIPILFLFGMATGLIDVTMNIHAIRIEKLSHKHLLSGIHGMWSLGGFAGAGIFGVWIWLGLTPLFSTGAATVIMLVLLLAFGPHLLSEPQTTGKRNSPIFAIPRGVVILIGLICCISFICEGAMMDWSGVLMLQEKGFPVSHAGTAYAIFSAAMLTMRFVGDALVMHCGSRPIIFGGVSLAIGGLLLVIFTTPAWLIYTGFFLIGIGLANIVPVFYSFMGQQKEMPIHLAVSAVSTVGYLGSLLGPAAIGFIAHQTSLYISFMTLAALLVLLLLIARHVYAKAA
jgi:predicted MFS family arabinose efflux permease